MDLHPVIEQRFQKIEEDIEGMKDFIMPFLESRFQELEKKLEQLRLKFDSEATPDFTAQEVSELTDKEN